MAILDAQVSDPSKPIAPAQVKEKLRTGQWDDAAALSLVINDAITAENYESSKQWVAGWSTGNTLYQSPFTARYWEGTMVQRSSIPFFTVASAVNSLTPQILNGLFFEDPPFMIQPRASGTSEQEAVAVGDVLGFQLQDTGFREELRLGVINALLFGTTIWKWGWETLTETYETVVRKPPTTLPNPVPGAPNIQIDEEDEDLEIESVEVEIDRPFFEHIKNLRHVLVDPTLSVPDISKGKFVIERIYMTWNELNDLRERPGFDIPSEEELIELFLPPKEPVEMATGETSLKNPVWDMRAKERWDEATIDPFNEPLETLWRWDNDKLIVILQKKRVLFNDDNQFHKIPYLSVGWWDVPEGFYSMGLAKTVGSEQQLQQGVVNTWLDGVALNLNPSWKRIQGKSVPTQSIRLSPGKVINVESKDDITPLERTPAVPEAGEHIAMSQSRVDQLAGAGALNTQGMGAGHSNLARSATGANLLANSATTAPDFVEKLANQVIIPLLNNFHQMNFRLLPKKMLKRILNDELQHDYLKAQGDVVNLYNAKVKFSILAGAKMAAKRAMQAQLPVIIQFLTNEQTTQQLAIAGYRVDVLQLMRDMYQVGEWKDAADIIVKMTDDEQQRAQQNSPAALTQMKVQGAQQQQQQKHSDALDIVDSENVARAGREVLRSALEKSETPEDLTGGPSPTNVGFTQG